MKYSTAIRPWANRRQEKMSKADIIIGIPTYNNQATIENVIDNVSEGIQKYYRGMSTLIVVADGGSTDDTRDVANAKTVYPHIEKMVTIYRGTPGKSSAYKMIFESAKFLNSRVCVIIDPVNKTIDQEWVKNLIDPVLIADYHYVTPIYENAENDIFVSNNISYFFVRTLIGQQILQPIGGDIGISGNLASFFIEQDIWEHKSSAYGIDLWLLLIAVKEGFRLCQSYIGYKNKDFNSNLEHLEENFFETISTVFEITEMHGDFLKTIEESSITFTYNESPQKSTEASELFCYKECIKLFEEGYSHFHPIWESILEKENLEGVDRAYKLNEDDFSFEADLLAKIIFNFANSYYDWGRYKYKVTQCISPIYFGYLAGYLKKIRASNKDATKEVVSNDAKIFEELKGILFR